MSKGERHTRNHKTILKTDVYGDAGRIPTISDEFYPRTIIRYRNSYYDDGSQAHPTQKPVALYEYLTLTYTNPGETVLDICAGSGTTGVACIKTGRNFIGIEKVESYFSIMERRIREAQAQMVMPV